MYNTHFRSDMFFWAQPHTSRWPKDAAESNAGVRLDIATATATTDVAVTVAVGKHAHRDIYKSH